MLNLNPRSEMSSSTLTAHWLLAFHLPGYNNRQMSIQWPLLSRTFTTTDFYAQYRFVIDQVPVKTGGFYPMPLIWCAGAPTIYCTATSLVASILSNPALTIS